MKLHPTPIEGLLVVEGAIHADPRGRFQRVFCERELMDAGLDFSVSQANLSMTRGRGSIRGMHFQRPPAAECKLVRCLRGRVFDVAVDLRAGSPTRLQWHGVELVGGDARALLVPRGFAHGFQCLEEECELLYFHDHPWSPPHEGGLRYDDPMLAIAWPLPVATVSDRDRSHALLTPDFSGMDL